MKIVNDKLYNWASEIDDVTLEQAEKTSKLSIIAGHVALMPDAHLGKGATIGSVIPTYDAVIPAAVGVDLGCGMIASKTTLYEDNLPDDLGPLLSMVESRIPSGLGKAHTRISDHAREWLANNPPSPSVTRDLEKTILTQYGTLGSGNHFFEICLDQNDCVWVILHSGSRGIGNKLANIWIKQAKSLWTNLRFNSGREELEDIELAYFTQRDPQFHGYITDMIWSQKYAFGNRNEMMTNALNGLFALVGGMEEKRINCHHNFTEREIHNIDGVDREVWVTRKGAIRAGVGDWGLIPGSMGTKSYVVEGLGNTLSYSSCSHGAGRRMSRTQAKKTFSIEDLNKAMEGKEWLSDSAQYLVDEIPMSYKDIDTVMEDQKDLVKVHYTLRQILNYKGV